MIRYYAYTKKDDDRKANDDRIMITGEVFADGCITGAAQTPLAAVVCDGVGGNKHGDIAAQITAEAFRDFSCDKEILFNLTKTIIETNEAIMQRQEEDTDLAGMACTLSGLYFAENEYYIFNLGDSRAYAAYDEHTTQISRDHTKARELKDQAKDHNIKVPGYYNNIITRYMGGNGWACEPYIAVNTLRDGMVFLLCSDGTYKSLPDEQLKDILSGHDTLKEKAERVLSAVTGSSHKDDKSFIILQYLSQKTA